MFHVLTVGTAMLGWHACADRLLRGAIPIAPLRSLPSSLFTHGRLVHAVNILIIAEDDLSQKCPAFTGQIF